MRIGEIAKLTGLNISNIRFYERKGLLCPEREEDSKYRDYTEADVLRVKEIMLYPVKVEALCSHRGKVNYALQKFLKYSVHNGLHNSDFLSYFNYD